METSHWSQFRGNVMWRLVIGRSLEENAVWRLIESIDSIISCSPSLSLAWSSPALTYIAHENLGVWREQNHRWLELTDVHRQTTNGIRVTVLPFYIGTKEMEHCNVYWWRCVYVLMDR